jgi:hypothetical protein
MIRQLAVGLVLVVAASALNAQAYHPDPAPGEQGSRNIHIVGHLPLNVSGPFNTSDIELEQELSRPYVYVDHANEAGLNNPTIGFDIISIKDPSRPKVIYTWHMENEALHKGAGSLAPAYVKTKGRYYFVNGFQFRQGGPDVDLGAIVWDVTGLPDTSKVKEVARLRVPEFPGGFHETFAYKHSTGIPIIIAQTSSPAAYLYDIDKVVAGDPNPVVGKAMNPTEGQAGARPSWHDFYAGYDPATKQDKLYAAGGGGAFVYDITNPADIKIIASVTGVAGATSIHTFTPDPTGRYAMAQPLPTYQYSPARIFDLKPALDGTVKTISRPIGAWSPSWNGSVHNFEVRWPYVFVAGQSDAFQVVNMMDPTNPYTVGYYVTRPGPFLHGIGIAGFTDQRPGGRSNSMYEGAWGVDVRNADGLIVISDFDSGFWAFKMDGFEGWNGHQWGVPNVSSVQDWDNGPDGAPKPGKVS